MLAQGDIRSYVGPITIALSLTRHMLMILVATLRTQSRYGKPPRVMAAMLSLAVAVLLVAGVRPAAGQTLDDGVMIAPHQLRSTVTYGRETWDQYWEGTVKRSNGNIGTITTRSATWMGAYGLTRRASLLATLPYVWTEASQGVLRGMQGRQDLTVAVKYRLAEMSLAERLAVRVLAVGGVGSPTSDYTPDFLPLSIGLHDRQALARAGVYAKDRTGLFLDGWAGHVWRGSVQLDRPAYYTNGQLVESHDVAMPEVSTYSASVGFQRGRLCLPVGISAQRTLGGGDIRRQDAPFVSNRMDFTKAHAELMYILPTAPSIQVELGLARTLRGRNVGEGTSFTFGVTHIRR